MSFPALSTGGVFSRQEAVGIDYRGLTGRGGGRIMGGLTKWPGRCVNSPGPGHGGMSSMPATDTTPTQRPVRAATILRDLGGARAVVNVEDRDVSVSFGDTNSRVVLIDRPVILRRLLEDGIAQIDAVEAGR